MTGQMLASRVLGPPAPNTFHVSRAAKHATALVEDLQLRRRAYKKELAANKKAARSVSAAASQALIADPSGVLWTCQWHSSQYKSHRAA